MPIPGKARGRGTRAMCAAPSVVLGMGSEAVEDRRAGQQPVDVDAARATVARQRDACRLIAAIAGGASVTDLEPGCLVRPGGYGLVGRVKVAVHGGAFPGAIGAKGRSSVASMPSPARGGRFASDHSKRIQS